MENSEEIFGEIGRFFSEIVKSLGKFIICPGKYWKILKILRGTIWGKIWKNESKFWRNFLDKKCIKSRLIRNSLFAPNRAFLSHLPNTSYLNRIYIRAINRIYIRANARAIREEIIFVDASSGRLSIYTEMAVTSKCVLSVLVISFTYFNTETY